MTENDNIHIHLELADEELPFASERVWASRVGPNYRIENIPFYARGWAFGDVVNCVARDDGKLWCDSLVEASGHSTVRLAFNESNDVESVRKDIHALGCSSELDTPRLLAVDVPPTVQYSVVREYLSGKQREGVLEWEEGCLGQS